MFDQTIRIPKLPSGPVRVLPQQFAPARPRRWPFVVAAVAAVLALAAVAVTPLALRHNNSRSEQAQELLRSLGR
jgi:hypothetical protein